MGTPEFVAGWSEAQMAWDPPTQSLWLVFKERGVSWRRMSSACEGCAKSGWLVSGLHHTFI